MVSILKNYSDTAKKVADLTGTLAVGLLLMQPVNALIQLGAATVEQISERMTLDEARNYVVNSGVCKGWTLAQVAERRAPSLRFYVFSDNGDNVLKAAATIVLNDMGMRKAG